MDPKPVDISGISLDTKVSDLPFGKREGGAQNLAQTTTKIISFGLGKSVVYYIDGFSELSPSGTAIFLARADTDGKKEGKYFGVGFPESSETLRDVEERVRGAYEKMQSLFS